MEPINSSAYQRQNNYIPEDTGIKPNGPIININRRNDEFQDRNPELSCLVNSLFCLVSPFVGCCALTEVKPMYDKIIQRFGNVRYVLREPGCYCINPCCTSANDVYMGLNDIEIMNMSANDKTGSPLKVSAQFVYRVSDSISASYKTSNLYKFLKDQGETALRAVLAHYPYDVDHHETECLRKHSDNIDNHLRQFLQEIVNPIGIKIEKFSLFSVGFEEKMEKLLLAKQEAHAEVVARTTIAEGVTGILQEIFTRFNLLGVKLSEDKKNALATNLTLLLVNHGHTTLNIFESNAPAQLQMPQQLPPAAAAKE